MKGRIVWRAHVTRVQVGGSLFDLGQRSLVAAVAVANERGFVLDVPEDERAETERLVAMLGNEK